MKYIIISLTLVALSLHSCQSNKTDQAQSSDTQIEEQDTIATKHKAPSSAKADTSDTKKSTGNTITAEQAYEGVNNYCHKEYDWSVAEGNPSIMYVKKGEETESEYQIVFRSYTGAFVYFHVNKADGKTLMIEHVPSLNITNEAGTINLLDYIH